MLLYPILSASIKHYLNTVQPLNIIFAEKTHPLALVQPDQKNRLKPLIVNGCRLLKLKWKNPRGVKHSIFCLIRLNHGRFFTFNDKTL